MIKRHVHHRLNRTPDFLGLQATRLCGATHWLRSDNNDVTVFRGGAQEYIRSCRALNCLGLRVVPDSHADDQAQLYCRSPARHATTTARQPRLPAAPVVRVLAMLARVLSLFLSLALLLDYLTGLLRPRPTFDAPSCSFHQQSLALCPCLLQIVDSQSNLFDGVMGASLPSLPLTLLLPFFATFTLPSSPPPVRASIMSTSIGVAPVAPSRDS